MHAPSVGEGLQASALLERLRAWHPEWQLVYTHFSPSAESFARTLPVDLADYLPWDLPDAAEVLLEEFRPDGLVFTKLDLWPELATRAASRGVPVGLVAATVSPLSGRLRWPARALLRPGYAAVTAAGAIAEADASRLERLGVSPERIRVLGDPRFDSALERVRRVNPHDPLIGMVAGAPTLVAGSTWPTDEEILLDAFAAVRARIAEARLIIVPHEPGPGQVRELEAAVVARHLPAAGLLSGGGTLAPILIVDRIGLLATLYSAGGLAYVGGGFGRAGLHSVLEPAAWGRPVLFGPRWQSSREAGLLLQAGAGFALPPQDSAHALADRWCEWLMDDVTRAAAGRQALAVVEAGLGAAERNARLVE
jgi:3-deoxy-D-manno-octulosonic-acid transferase